MNIIFWHLLREFPVFQTLESVWTMSAASNTLASTAMGTWTWNTLDPVDVGAWTWITLVDSGNGVGWTYWTLDSTGSSRTALVPATEVCWTWKTLPSRVSDWGCSVMPWTVSGGGALGISSTSYARSLLTLIWIRMKTHYPVHFQKTQLQDPIFKFICLISENGPLIICMGHFPTK